MPQQRRKNFYENISQPTSTAPRPARCTALQSDGSECTRVVESQRDLCFMDRSEKNRLYVSYKEAQADYEARGDPTSKRSIDAMEEMVQVGEKVVTLRDEVNRRFFSRVKENNRGHIQQILKIKHEVDSLKSRIASQKPSPTSDAAVEGTTSTTAAGGSEGQTFMYRSLLSPDVAMSELDHLPRDSHVVIMRNFLDFMRDGQVDKIYKIFPSLNDATNLVHDRDSGNKSEPDEGDLVLRNVFREFLVWTGDTDVLARASKTETIDAFLRQFNSRKHQQRALLQRNAKSQRRRFASFC